MILITDQSSQLTELDEQCYAYMKQGHRPSTRRNKRSQATIYQHFCKTHGLSEFPADEWQYVRYVAYTAERVTSAGTVENYVAGVRTLHKIAGYQTPSTLAPNLNLIMDGIKAHLAKPVNQVTPMTEEILKNISGIVTYNNSFEFCVFSTMLTGFYLVLRSSNLVPLSSVQFNPKEQLSRWHVGIDEDLDLVLFCIEWSKNNQNYKRELWVPVKPAKDKRICLVRVLDRYFKAMPLQQDQPWFAYYNDKKQVCALNYAQLNEQIKEWVTKTGRNGKTFTTHCLHRGGMNHAVKCGISPDYIQVMGDWVSQSFLVYIDFALDLRLELAEKIASR